jgi:hypothetical protein
VKLAVVAVAASLALIARLRMRRGPASHPERPACAETGTLATVMAATALLTAVPPPADANRALPFPPPPVGPTVPVGALAGQVSVFGQASAGQLVVRLFIPGSEDTQAPRDSGAPIQITGAPTAAPRYGLSAALADPNGRSEQPGQRAGIYPHLPHPLPEHLRSRRSRHRPIRDTGPRAVPSTFIFDTRHRIAAVFLGAVRYTVFNAAVLQVPKEQR